MKYTTWAAWAFAAAGALGIWTYGANLERAEAGEVGPKIFDNRLLRGDYAIHDLIFLPTPGAPAYRAGQRTFNGTGGVEAGELNGAIYNQSYAVRNKGLVEFNGSTPAAGSVGLQSMPGQDDRDAFVALQTRRADSDAPAGISQRHGAFRLSLRLAGITDLENPTEDPRRVRANVLDGKNYHYRAVVARPGTGWRGITGTARGQAPGLGSPRALIIDPDGASAYGIEPLISPLGRMNLKATDEGEDFLYATVLPTGELIAESLDSEVDPRAAVSGDYTGLALYLRRGSNMTTRSLEGRYRYHRILVDGDGAHEVSVGEIYFAGNGAYAGYRHTNGSSSAQQFSGTVAVESDGRFRVDGRSPREGVVSSSGNLAVVLEDGASASAGSNQTFSFQMWIRTGGGAPTYNDADGDGLENFQENTNNPDHPDPIDRDTDGDGLIDSIDPRPLERDDHVALNPTSVVFTREVGADDPAPQTVTMGNTTNPFFIWAVSDNRSWISLDPGSGRGGGQFTVSVDTDGFTMDDSPYRGTIVANVPGMNNHPFQIPVTVHIVPETPDYAPSPERLDFQLFEGAALSRPLFIDVDADAEVTGWTLNPGASWLSASPLGGVGNESVTITADTAGLGPGLYETTLAIAPASGGGLSAEVPVTLAVLEPRGPNDVFELYPSGEAQNAPAAAFDPETGRYGIVWVEDGAVWATVLDRELAPAMPAQPISLDAEGGPPTNPAIAANPENDSFWVMWEQAPPDSAAPDVRGRVIGLPGGLGPNTPIIAGGSGAQFAPTLAYDAGAGEMVIAFTDASGANADVDYTVYDASTGDSVRTGGFAFGPEEEGQAQLAYDPERDEFLVTWRAADGGGAELIGRRYGSGLEAEGAAFLLSPGLANPSGARFAFDAAGDRWFMALRGASGVRVGRFAAGEAAPEVDWLWETSEATPASPGLALAPAALQLRAVWNRSNALENRYQRIALEGAVLGPEAPFPSSGDQESPRIVYNSLDREYLYLWLETGNSGPRRILGQRVADSLPDEDGDGLTNEYELANGLDPFDPDGDHGADGDPDGDGLTNIVEQELETEARNPDSDGDGLPDGLEDANGNGETDSGESDPNAADSDNDGYDDAAEVYLGSDPTNPGAAPEPGIYFIESEPAAPGVAAEIEVRVVVNASGVYTLSLNSPAASGWNPPTGWKSAAPGNRSRLLSAGSHSFTASAEAAASGIGAFAFRLHGNGLDITAETLLAAEGLEPVPAEEAAALAAQYAPVIRTQRDEALGPISVEQFLHRGQLERDGAAALPASKALLGAQRFAGAAIGQPAADAAELIAAYREDRAAFPATVYASAVRAGDVTAIQYYILWPGDLWGVSAPGGHRHEGDWEVFQVLIGDDGRPTRAAATRQWRLGESGAASRHWTSVETAADGRPVLFAGRGGHSLYFAPGTAEYDGAVEQTDGMGRWFIPEGHDSAYDNTAPYAIERLPRLGEADGPAWRRFPGHWGQLDFPQGPDDAGPAALADGPRGPVFLGGGAGPWLDPMGWAEAAEEESAAPRFAVMGQFPAEFTGMAAVATGSRGEIHRVPVSESGAFEFNLPRGLYTLSAVEPDGPFAETFQAAAEFEWEAGATNLFPVAGDLNLGAFVLDNGALTGPEPYAASDWDGDSIPDFEDPDADNDGTPNAQDGDAFEDGFLDALQSQDFDGDGVLAYYDADEDSVAAPDFDGDGFADEVDVDADNDGFTDPRERAAGSNPFRFNDRPDALLGDVNGDGRVNAVDVQSVINMALDLIPFNPRADFNSDGEISAVDVQSLINRALGLPV